VLDTQGVLLPNMACTILRMIVTELDQVGLAARVVEFDTALWGRSQVYRDSDEV
jgi:hypothetical protein